MLPRIILLVLFLILIVFSGVMIFIFRNERKNNQELSETISLKIYFNNRLLDPQVVCTKVFPVERQISKNIETTRAALEELLKGPNEKEKSEGYFTSINSGVSINNISIKNGIAYIDFDEQLEFQVGGSCRVSSIYAQIKNTIEQFQEIQKTIISINGRTEDILQP